MKRFYRNLKFLLITLLVYFGISVLRNLIFGNFSQWIISFANPMVWINAFFLGAFDLINGDAMWFMVALLYCYLIFCILIKSDMMKTAYKAIPLLILLRIGMETCTNSFGANWHLSGNAIIGGLPIMLLGHFIVSRESQIKQTETKKLMIICVFSFILLFLSVNVKVGGLDVSQVFKISTAVVAFIICLCKPKFDRCKILSEVGGKYSLIVYLSHFMIGVLERDLLFKIGGE